ncbi:hypothetical protein VTN77DRAFT_6241 [Rasamsonia byssochlamydoides]|uniref:uncharacterized protein n=1 Tax=Rasamsonia byssochlamydoides TaxID=89139 RepID=UPI00374328CB
MEGFTPALVYRLRRETRYLREDLDNKDRKIAEMEDKFENRFSSVEDRMTHIENVFRLFKLMFFPDSDDEIEGEEESVNKADQEMKSFYNRFLIDYSRLQERLANAPAEITLLFNLRDRVCLRYRTEATAELKREILEGCDDIMNAWIDSTRPDDPVEYSGKDMRLKFQDVRDLHEEWRKSVPSPITDDGMA